MTGSMNHPRKLTLASASPRRRQLLEMIGIPLEVRPSHIPEVRFPDEPPTVYAARLARQKAESVEGAYVLGADTTVVLDEHVLEKPVDADDALRILSLLQGRTHEVVTAIALVAGGVTRERVGMTRVTFAEADAKTLRAYIATGEPMDKAGAYGIQGYGAALIERIDGDFFTVMGLPIRLVLELLGEAGWIYEFRR